MMPAVDSSLTYTYFGMGVEEPSIAIQNAQLKIRLQTELQQLGNEFNGLHQRAVHERVRYGYQGCLHKVFLMLRRIDGSLMEDNRSVPEPVVDIFYKLHLFFWNNPKPEILLNLHAIHVSVIGILRQRMPFINNPWSKKGAAVVREQDLELLTCGQTVEILYHFALDVLGKVRSPSPEQVQGILGSVEFQPESCVGRGVLLNYETDQAMFRPSNNFLHGLLNFLSAARGERPLDLLGVFKEWENFLIVGREFAEKAFPIILAQAEKDHQFWVDIGDRQKRSMQDEDPEELCASYDGSGKPISFLKV